NGLIWPRRGSPRECGRTRGPGRVHWSLIRKPQTQSVSSFSPTAQIAHSINVIEEKWFASTTVKQRDKDDSDSLGRSPLPLAEGRVDDDDSADQDVLDFNRDFKCADAILENPQ